MGKKMWREIRLSLSPKSDLWPSSAYAEQRRWITRPKWKLPQTAENFLRLPLLSSLFELSFDIAAPAAHAQMSFLLQILENIIFPRPIVVVRTLLLVSFRNKFS